MKILVTGGAGSIGSAVIGHVISNTTDSVVNVDKLTYAGNVESLAAVSQSSRYVFAAVEICGRDQIDRVLRVHQPDAVMHLAAEPHVDHSISGPSEYIQTKIIGTYTLLEAVRHYWINLVDGDKVKFRFHYVSTDEVNGDLDGPEDFSTKNEPYHLSSPYSASKASSDQLVRAWGRTYAYLPHSSLVKNVQDSRGDDQRYVTDSSKIQGELGWAPKNTFEFGVRKTVERYLANIEWVEHVKSGSYHLWMDQNHTDRSNKL